MSKEVKKLKTGEDRNLKTNSILIRKIFKQIGVAIKVSYSSEKDTITCQDLNINKSWIVSTTILYNSVQYKIEFLEKKVRVYTNVQVNLKRVIKTILKDRIDYQIYMAVEGLPGKDYNELHH